MAMKKLSLAAIGCAAAFMAMPVLGNEPPPGQADPISLTRTSPSVIGFGNTPADIYGEVFGAGMGGWDAGGPGPVMHVKDIGYGLQPMADNNDGHSGGEFDSQAPVVIYFSGDANSVGMPGTEYDHQAQRIQAAGDRFVTNGSANVGPRTVMMLNAGPTFIGGPVLPGPMGNFPINMLSANQTRYNEIPTLPPMNYNSYVPPAGATRMDDMDAVELMPFDFNGDLIHDTPIYFSLDAQSPSLGLFGSSPADVLVSPPNTPNFGVFAPAVRLGLSPFDEVDALAVWDMNGDWAADQNVFTDFALFSLAPGSPGLAGPDMLMGTIDDYSPADIIVTDFSGVNMLYLPAQALGMLPSDNIDAIDVEPWVDETSIEIFEEIWDLPAVAGDLNADGFVGIADLNLVLSFWNQTVPPAPSIADPNGDGFIGIADLNIVLGNWNAGVPPPPTNVPEPASVVLLALAGLATLGRRVV
jgi:hypothetical protein